MKYPTIEEVQEASHLQICKWHRFLPSASNDEQIIIQKKIHGKYISGGGMSHQISKHIGW